MMVATPDQGGLRSAARSPGASPARVIGGFTAMFVGVALISYGTHFVAKTGTCSGTGYVSYGPVPKCPGSEALYIMSAFFVGPLAAIVGWLVARAWGWLWPATCVGVGTGLVTISPQTSASTGARAFGLIGGIGLFALAGLSVTVTLRKRRRPSARPAAGPGVPAWPSAPAPAQLAPPAWLAPPAPPAPPARPAPQGRRYATPDRPDPLATIARLAQLRDAGALTEDEIEAQKARLLAEL